MVAIQRYGNSSMEQECFSVRIFGFNKLWIVSTVILVSRGLYIYRLWATDTIAGLCASWSRDSHQGWAEKQIWRIPQQSHFRRRLAVGEWGGRWLGCSSILFRYPLSSCAIGPRDEAQRHIVDGEITLQSTWQENNAGEGDWEGIHTTMGNIVVILSRLFQLCSLGCSVVLSLQISV